jgi:hypothetical protein
MGNPRRIPEPRYCVVCGEFIPRGRECAKEYEERKLCSWTTDEKEMKCLYVYRSKSAAMKVDKLERGLPRQEKKRKSKVPSSKRLLEMARESLVIDARRFKEAFNNPQMLRRQCGWLMETTP